MFVLVNGSNGVNVGNIIYGFFYWFSDLRFNDICVGFYVVGGNGNDRWVNIWVFVYV